MEFRILGPLEVAAKGKLVALGPPKQRAVLAVLLLHANAVVSSERLIEEVWGEKAPPTASKLVQVYVSQLRRALEAAGDAAILRTRPPGYVMELPPDQLDATRFTELVTRARIEAKAGLIEDALSTYTDALELWRGPMLADITLESQAWTEVERTAELRLAAVAERIDCELSLGHHARLIGELEALTADQPLHERFWAQLMLALYRSGRQSEALGAYHQARVALREQVGLAPGPELQRLERAILTQDPGLEPTTPLRQSSVRAAPAVSAEPVRGLHLSRLAGRRLAVAAIAPALVAAGVIATVLIDGSSSDRTVSVVVASDSIAVVDETKNALVDEIPLRTRPAAIAFGAGSLWVAARDDETLLQIDPNTHDVIRTTGLGAEPTSIAVGEGSVWVLCGPARRLFQFDASTGVLVRKLAVEGKLPRRPKRGLNIPPLGVANTEPFDVVAGGGAAWIAFANAIGRIDDRTHRLEHTWVAGGPLSFGTASSRLAGAVWRFSARGALVRIDASTRKVKQAIPLPRVGTDAGISGVVATGDAVWAIRWTDDTAWMIDTRLGRVTAVIPLGHAPIDIAVDRNAVWTANEDGTLSRVNAKSGTLVRTIPLGRGPRVAFPVQLAVGHGSVWIAMH